MPSDVRDRMIAGAIRLRALYGLQATSFAEALEVTGAPRGSIIIFPKAKTNSSVMRSTLLAHMDEQTPDLISLMRTSFTPS
jgi:hypothetical protein